MAQISSITPSTLRRLCNAPRLCGRFRPTIRLGYIGRTIDEIEFLPGGIIRYYIGGEEIARFKKLAYIDEAQQP